MFPSYSWRGPKFSDTWSRTVSHSTDRQMQTKLSTYNWRNYRVKPYGLLACQEAMEDKIPRIVQRHKFFVYVKSWPRIWVLTLAIRISFLLFVLFIYINSEIVFPYLTTDLHHRQSSARSELTNIRKSQRFVKQTKKRKIMCIHLLATVNDTFVLWPIGVFSRLLGSYGNSRPTMYENITQTFELAT
jgi:hypothetical protein